jgi:hypothetical protein
MSESKYSGMSLLADLKMQRIRQINMENEEPKLMHR